MTSDIENRFICIKENFDPIAVLNLYLLKTDKYETLQKKTM